MPPLGPIKRRDLIRYLKQLGFEGPYSGKRHQFMIRGQLRAILPNPHEGDIDISLLGRILRQLEISKDEWENL